MFKNMKLATKLAMGFGILIVISAILGYTGWNSVGTIEKQVTNADDANRLIKWSLDGRMMEKNFIQRKDKKYYEDGQELATRFLEQCEVTGNNLNVLADKEMVNKSGQEIKVWLTGLQEYVELEDKKIAADAEMVAGARAAIEEIEKMRADQKVKLTQEMDAENASEVLLDRLAKADDANRLNKYILESRRQEKNFILRHDEKYVDAVRKEVDEMIALAEDLNSRFNQQVNKDQVAAVIAGINRYKHNFDEYVKMVNQQREKEEDMVAAGRAIQEEADGLRQVQKGKMDSTMASSNMLMITLAIGAIVLGLILAYTITRSITKPINKTIEQLSSGSEQVSSASSQVSSSSQQMAEGASEQASSLEETSASMEEMGSMSRQIADNSREANNLSGQSSAAAEKGNEAMQRMSTAIDDIKKSSDETAKIIKTIDEIAFQTNLLALNAAVEAARAGEAGKGFAVVAEEVRNLAMRSAEAARNTNDMIEGSQKNADNGVQVAQEVAESLGTIVTSAQKVTGLINEISAASDEQAKGVDQINQAMSQMDQVTQSNAANAEESASASEELNAQAQELMKVVQNLQEVVGGKGSVVRSTATTTWKHQDKWDQPKTHQMKDHIRTLLHKKETRPAAKPGNGGPKSGKAKPEDLIPLEENEAEFEEAFKS
jgi:methyl-accepting chemotaxis protein